jgi:N-acetylglutamate synthase-like GNAT family acetyltransferase
MKHSTFIRTAVPADLRFIDHLQRNFSNQLGHLPRTALAEHLAAGNITLANECGQEAGYILARPPSTHSSTTARIIQVAIAIDAQRRQHATALVDLTAALAARRGARVLAATVRLDVDAHDFFAAAGFVATHRRDTPTARRLPSIVYRRPLVQMATRELFDLDVVLRFRGAGGRFTRSSATAHRFSRLAGGDCRRLLRAAR